MKATLAPAFALAALALTPSAWGQIPNIQLPGNVQLPNVVVPNLGTSGGDEAATIARATLRVRIAPPALRDETPPPAPTPGHIWARGYWNYARNHYVWVPGHYESPHPGQEWYPARWVQRDNTWIFLRGHWGPIHTNLRVTTPGDRDDGVWVLSPPPAPQVESPPPAPSTLHFWVGGHWNYQDNHYVWAPGHWEGRRTGYVWDDGEWEHVGTRWRWVPGHWVRQ